MPSALSLWVQVSCSVGRQCLGRSAIPRSLTAVTAPVIKLLNSTFVPSVVIRVKQVSLPSTCSLDYHWIDWHVFCAYCQSLRQSSLAAYHHEVIACSVLFRKSTVSDSGSDQIWF